MKKLAAIFGPALFLLVFTLMASLPAAANAIPPLGQGISDQLTVENGSGAIVAQITLNEDGTATYSGTAGGGVACMNLSTGQSCSLTGPESQNNFYFFYDASFADGTQRAATTVLCESSTCSSTSANYSDVVGVTDLADAGTFLGFMSDTETQNANVAAFLADGANTSINYAYESQQPSVGDLHYTSDTSYTAYFQSDGETSVPEPGTLTLLGAGLLGLALMAGSLKRKSLCSGNLSA